MHSEPQPASFAARPGSCFTGAPIARDRTNPTAATRLITTLLHMSPWIAHRYVTTSTPSRVGCGSIVQIFNARVHIGHKETSITVCVRARSRGRPWSRPSREISNWPMLLPV
jgi:hypothetical protein